VTDNAVPMPRLLLPLGIFIALVLLLAVGLTLNPREVPSPLIGKPAPAFSLPQLRAPEKSFSPAEMAGKVWVLNVWASWCAPCLEEHPQITALAAMKIAPVVGLNYKDEPPDALAWLKRNGDPYLLSTSDIAGQIGIDYGVYGVPETYVIDQRGVIRYKKIGPVRPETLQKKILPLIEELRGG
jgi:cytochrome c biogenesis protein CcmG, thiol:disulfide interchange protein DsbE